MLPAQITPWVPTSVHAVMATNKWNSSLWHPAYEASVSTRHGSALLQHSFPGCKPVFPEKTLHLGISKCKRTASLQLKHWASDMSDLSQRQKAAWVTCFISAPSFQPRVRDKTSAQNTAQLGTDTRSNTHRGSQTRLTQHSESCHRYREVSCAWNSGSTDVHARVLHLYVRDHEVSIPQHTSVEDINGLMV